MGIIQCNNGEGDGFAFRYIKDFCVRCLGPGQFFRPEVLSCSGARVVAATAFAMLRTQTLPICEGILGPKSFQLLRRAGWLRYQSSDPGRSPLLWQVAWVGRSITMNKHHSDVPIPINPGTAMACVRIENVQNMIPHESII